MSGRLLAWLAAVALALAGLAYAVRTGDDERARPARAAATPDPTVIYDRGVAAGHDSGEHDGARRGRREGERAGRHEGERLGRREGEHDGRRDGERDGERLGRQAGERVGFERGSAAGIQRGEQAGAQAVLGGFGQWVPGAYYVVTVAPGGSPAVPYRIATRSPLRPMTNYRLCESDQGRLCALPAIVASGG